MLEKGPRANGVKPTEQTSIRESTADALSQHFSPNGRESAVSPETQKRAWDLVGAYVNGAEATGIVRGFLAGSGGEEGRSYLWTIFNRNYSLRRMVGASFGELSHLGVQFKRGMEEIGAPVRVSYVMPSGLKSVMAACAERGIQTEVFRL